MLLIRLGPYNLHKYSLFTLSRLMRNAIDVNIKGIQKVPGETPLEVAKNVILANARHDIFLAGMRNYRYMWVSDTGVSFKGLTKVLKPHQLERYLFQMIKLSEIRGSVQSCYSSSDAFNMPYRRADGLPWLIYMISEYVKLVKNNEFLERNRELIQGFLDGYINDRFDGLLIKKEITGDWMDTVFRPSSTWNNLCALMMLKRAKDLNFKLSINFADVESAILENRLKGNYLIEYADTKRIGVDAMVLAIYLQSFDDKILRLFIDKIDSLNLTQPIPMQTCITPFDSSIIPPLTRISVLYHNAIWLHMGIMYANGKKNLGLNISKEQSKIEEVVMRYKNFLEVFNPDGSVYKTLVQTTELGLSMSAAQYIELVG